MKKTMFFNHYIFLIYLLFGFFIQIRELANPLNVLEKLMKLIVRLAHCGLIHGDFNEFNLMIDDKGKITVIGNIIFLRKTA